MSLQNWKLCCLCQIDSREKLICPKFTESGSSYATLARNLRKFEELGSIPIDVPIQNLDTGSGIEETLKYNRALWHKSCFTRCNTLKLQRAEKRRREASDEVCDDSFAGQNPSKRRSRVRVIETTDTDTTIERTCFFCNEATGNLHRASTLDLDRNVRCAAEKLGDWELLAKLAAGDMHAIDAYYHKSCLTSLYNRSRNLQETTSSLSTVDDDGEIPAESIAFAELIAYILESASIGSCLQFKMSDLARLYSFRLEELGLSVASRVNSTRLKNRILAQLPKLHAYYDGKEVKLAFPSDIGTALEFAHDTNYDVEAMHLAKAARLVRKEMLIKDQVFTGTFTSDCQKKSVPDSLLALVKMILEGPSVRNQNLEEETTSNASAMISQLLLFNALKRARSGTSNATRHETSKETPISIYIALVIHVETRKRTLIDKFHQLGLCISYDRVLQISADLGNSICKQFNDDGLVCPPMLSKSVFTTGAVDNIDHNPSSRTAKDSFHGTAITLTQHPDHHSTGIKRSQVYLDPNAPKTKTVSKLPECYTNIAPAFEEAKKDVFVPKVSGKCKPSEVQADESMKDEFTWLNKVQQLLEKEKLEENEYLSWSAHFASVQENQLRPNAITSLLPLFNEKASTVAMIRHSMKLVKQSTQFLNPSQVPVIVMDQPLYTIAKQIQWTSPGQYGEDKYLVMMGGLHIEMASLKMIGHWLCNSGWSCALVQAEVMTSGKADAVLKASHITRARYAHQVSACALFLLQRKAYAEESQSGPDEDFEVWCGRRKKDYPQFHYWSTALELELLVLELVRSIREGNFTVYIQVLGKLIPWMFVLDLTNYSRWLPVHIRDLLELKRRHPSLYEEFFNGKFVAQKTQHRFSMIALDQNHEQENEMIKGDGGAVGLTENPAALRRWMISGPVVARVVKEFESNFQVQKATNNKHHEQTPSIQKSFANDVASLVTVMEEFGNPFAEKSKDLIVLDSKEIMPPHVVESVYTAKEKGESLYSTFVEERLSKCTTALSDTIARSNLPLFGNHETVKPNKPKSKVASLKSDCHLFARLYIACQAREGNLQEFFKHENQSSPPALSCGDQIRGGQKSDLMECFPVTPKTERPVVDVIVLDAAAVVNMLQPGKCKTFKDYATTVFLPYVTGQARGVKRVDLVWDRYLPNSLKKSARQARGMGERRRVCDSAPLPMNWKSFLRSDENKKELFQYLAECSLHLDTDNIVITTIDVDIGSSSATNKEGLAPCNHEEADTRILLHVNHASKNGLKKVMIKTVDTDVVVLAIAFLQRLDVEELWISFGVGKHLRYLPIHSITQVLTKEQCLALPFFHALTGCDNVSFFAGKGKKTAFQAWNCFPEVTDVFQSLSSPSVEVELSKNQITTLEQFIVIMYSHTCPYQRVNDARQALFSQGTKSIEHIPPTKGALEQHLKRAVYQASFVWGQSLEPIQELPSPSEWGWKASADGWSPVWTLLPEASKVCNELIQCGCKKACRGLCKCTKAKLPCTALCSCQGNCYQA